MNIKMVIKKSFYYLKRKIRERYTVIRYRNDMTRRIETSGVAIMELTKDQELGIVAYWKKKYNIDPDFNTFKWYYSINGIDDCRYISEDIYVNYIWARLNDINRCKGIGDKNLLDILYKGENLPNTIFRNINGFFLDKEYNLIDRDYAISLTKSYNKIVIKPSVDSYQGNNVRCINGDDCDKFIDFYEKNYIVQEVVQQHSSLSRLNISSVNVIRVTTLLLNGSIHVLNSIIRVGKPGSFTDHKNISIGITNDGRLKDYGFVVNGQKVTKLSNGLVFAGLRLEGYSEMKALVSRLHQRTPQAQLIGWDLTVDKDGLPLIIEANIGFPGIERGQCCNGPFFGELTDEVMDYVLNR